MGVVSLALSDLADQSMLLVGPRDNGGIAEQPIGLQSRDVVAFAGSPPQSLLVQDRDVAAPILDEPAPFQTTHHIGHPRSPDTQHHPQEFMGEQKIFPK